MIIDYGPSSSGDNQNVGGVGGEGIGIHHHHHQHGIKNETKPPRSSNGTINVNQLTIIPSLSSTSSNLSSSSSISTFVGSSSSILLTVTTMSTTTTTSQPESTPNHTQFARMFSFVNTESTINNLFGINDRDVPILIGAAVGALGLLIIVLAAIVSWYCCQYGIRRQRSVYCLDEENDKWASCSNLGSGIFADNESVIFTGMENLNKSTVRGHNIKRSLSAQLHMVNLNFTKKRANRMRNDSAAAIALNRSGATPTHSPYLTKETDCLVDNDSLIDNEAVVVYDERTVL